MNRVLRLVVPDRPIHRLDFIAYVGVTRRMHVYSPWYLYHLTTGR